MISLIDIMVFYCIMSIQYRARRALWCMESGAWPAACMRKKLEPVSGVCVFV